MPDNVRLAVLMLAVGALHVCACVSGSGDRRGTPKARHSLFRSKGAPWTIQCLQLQGPNRMRHVEQIAETLKHTPGIRSGHVFITDDRDGFARLYYGTYHRRTDRKTGKRSTPRRLVEDLKLIKELGTGPGEYYFMQAMVVRMPTPDVGKPEWDLARVDGAYTLQVGVFEPMDEFWEYKQAAVDFCELLREKGYDAYYYHTNASSIVTVGIFGPEALIPNERGLPSYSAEVLALQRKDDLLRYNRLNGAVYLAKTDTGAKTRVPSRLVRLPRAKETLSW